MDEEKRRLRRDISARLDGLPAGYLASAGRRIGEIVATLPEYGRARSVLAFAGTAREIDTLPLLERILADGKELALPLCTGPGRMEARRIDDLAKLQPGTYGIPEPPADGPVLAPEEIGLILVPCLACDRTGRRLGHGGGYYDRFLAGFQGAALLLCPEALLLERVPQGPLDIPVPAVVTERCIYRAGTEVFIQ